MSEAEIDEFEKEYGRPVDFISAPDASRVFVGTGLPPILFDYWDRIGFSKFLGGFFQVINPKDYEGALDAWLGDSKFRGLDRYYAIRMDAFGNMDAFGIKTGSAFTTSVFFHALLEAAEDDRAAIREGKGNDAIQAVLVRTLPEDVHEDSEEESIRLFFAAKDKLGDLGHNQIYAPVPAIPLGGQMRIEDLQIVDAPSYLRMVAEIAPPRVMTMRDLTRLAFGDGAEETLAGLLRK
ncbi:GAD-like domain-containing protein [Paracoccus sp. ME4]|uniref:GAD-like domain-containing protein n=1 Tax=Paracoccus sp. ME4 TaxID=3138066 RepID=UPI00398B1B8F